MFELEPAWLHAITTHAPLVLLPLATLAALLGLVLPRTQLRQIAFGLLCLGFIFAVVAKETGEQAAHHARDLATTAGAVDVEAIVLDTHITTTVADGNLLHTHAIMAEWTRNLYGGLFFVEAGLLGLRRREAPRWRPSPGLERAIRVVWIVVALAGLALVALTGHYGGLLVYDYGVGVKP